MVSSVGRHLFPVSLKYTFVTMKRVIIAYDTSSIPSRSSKNIRSEIRLNLIQNEERSKK